jgi:hypothetical protein
MKITEQQLRKIIREELEGPAEFGNSPNVISGLTNPK